MALLMKTSPTEHTFKGPCIGEGQVGISQGDWKKGGWKACGFRVRELRGGRKWV